MKEIEIKVKIDELTNQIGTAIKLNGFNNSIENVLEIIGILENIKNEQLDRLKVLDRKTFKG